MTTALLKEMGLTPSVLIRWAGAISVASALLFLAGALYGISILRERSRRRGPGSDLRRPRTMGGELRRLYFKTERNSVESPLSQLACSWLTEIKFQQTYTEGWSGSVKLVLGLEGGTNRARSLAQQQLTMPEIVDGFRGFLREAALSYTVIIGIDELDKIESDEDAFRFLNQIKSVFGIRGVFYLIAVSDNAMSNFERRGLPFRDAFDSSFDEIISVNHMNLATASQLLTERVIGMPVQFQALCYCLSGGLARELVRTCHDLVEQALLHGEYDLARLCARVVGVELRSRVYGIRIAAEKYSAEPQRTELLRLLLQVETALPVEEAELRSYGAALVDLAAAAESDGAEFDAVPSTPGRQEMPQRRDLPQLLRLAQEAGTFILFLAAIAHIFKDSLDEAAFRALQRDARFDLLARAYQALSVNPSLARRLIEAGSHSSCGGSEGL